MVALDTTMNPPSPGLEPALDTQVHGSSTYLQEHQEVSEPAQQQRDQERDNASIDASHRMGATQSESSQEKDERQKLRESE